MLLTAMDHIVLLYIISYFLFLISLKVIKVRIRAGLRMESNHATKKRRRLHVRTDDDEDEEEEEFESPSNTQAGQRVEDGMGDPNTTAPPVAGAQVDMFGVLQQRLARKAMSSDL